LVPALLEWPARVPRPRAVSLPCATYDIYPTLLELAGVTVEKQPPLDGISLVPLLDGKMKERPKPLGFWSYPAPGFRTPSKEWMDDLYAAQQAGREPADPARLFADAGKIKTRVPLDQFPGHAAWLDNSWKLHRIENQKDHNVKCELYDLAADTKEANDLSEREAPRTAAMQKQLEAWLKSVAASLNGADYSR